MICRSYVHDVHTFKLCDSQESRRGEILVNRLMRQCQQERRIATQLMQIRKEKDVIRRNRSRAYCSFHILYVKYKPTMPLYTTLCLH